MGKINAHIGHPEVTIDCPLEIFSDGIRHNSNIVLKGSIAYCGIENLKMVSVSYIPRDVTPKDLFDEVLKQIKEL